MERIVQPGAVEGEVDPPSSKSYAQRAIAAALLADGTSVLRGIELCDDTAAALRVVQALGAKVERTDPSTYAITGAGNRFSAKNVRIQGLRSDAQGSVFDIRDRAISPKILDIGESGLSTRLFTPVASLCHTPVTITGHSTILKRPMDMMLAPLLELGVSVTDNDGFLPITVCGPMHGGEVEIDGSVSSQFLTGLLIALPLAAHDTTVRVRGLRSIPYIDMTIDVMDKFGIDIDHRDYEEFYVPGARTYTSADFRVEGDWSAASCLLVAGAVAGSITVRNLHSVSLQADIAIIEALSRAGARIEQTSDAVTVSRRQLRAFEFDATDCPDLFPALAALAANCEGVSTITGTNRLTHKECHRGEAIFSEYGALDIEVDLSQENVMRIVGGRHGSDTGEGTLGTVEIKGGATVESFRDHRMAMSLAVAALNADAPVTIRDAECVSKSYGNFWVDFDNIKKRGS